MADRFLKHLPSGQVFIYAHPWIGHDDFEECLNAAGDPLPEPEPVVNPAPKGRAKKAAEAPAESSDADAALSAEASRGL